MRDWVNFGKVARGKIGMQCQYASRYIYGSSGNPALGSGLRFKGDSSDYHQLKIHRDDVDEFVRRVKGYREG